MSRVGKNPVIIPSGVSVEIAGNVVKAKGKLGELSLPFTDHVGITQKENALEVKPLHNSKQARMLWGTMRNRLHNLVQGVHEGFSIDLEITGVGFRAAVQGKELVLNLGFSHDVRFAIPEGITITCEKPTSVRVHGRDRQLVGQVASNIRGYKKPEPYKGKGIQYKGEVILRKEGKKK